MRIITTVVGAIFLQGCEPEKVVDQAGTSASKSNRDGKRVAIRTGSLETGSQPPKSKSTHDSGEQSGSMDQGSIEARNKILANLPAVLSSSSGGCSKAIARNLGLSEEERIILNTEGVRVFSELAALRKEKTRVTDIEPFDIGDSVIISPLTLAEIDNVPISIKNSGIDKERVELFEHLIKYQMKTEFTSQVVITLRRFEEVKISGLDLTGALMFEVQSTDSSGNQNIIQYPTGGFPTAKYGSFRIRENAYIREDQ